MKTLLITLALGFATLSHSTTARTEKKRIYRYSKTEDPKTIAESITELKTIFAQLRLKFREGVTEEQIIFGLQHTLADQRQTDQGKKFPATPEFMSGIVAYYRSGVTAILDNQSDVEITKLYVWALQDLSISEDESGYLRKTELEIQKRYNLDTRTFYKFDNRGNHPTEVNTDPMLLSKDKDGMNEGLGFKMAGTDKIFMKQYLASLLEPIK